MSEMKSDSKAKAWAPPSFPVGGRMLTDVRVVFCKRQKQRFKCSSSLHPSLVSIAIAYIKRVFCLSGCIGNVSVGDIFPIRPEMRRGRYPR
jgi:hypothetical protein